MKVGIVQRCGYKDEPTSAAQCTEALAALVTPELAELLEKVGNLVGGDKGWTSIGHFTSQDGERCHALAAYIREALALETNDESN